MFSKIKQWFKNIPTIDTPIMDYSVYKNPKFRVIMINDKIYIQIWKSDMYDRENGGHWWYIRMRNNGRPINQIDVPSPVDEPTTFETVEHACKVCKALIAGERYFEEFDKNKIIVIDCDCLIK